MELVSGSYGFEVVPRFLEHFWAPVLKYEDRKMGLGGCAEGEFDPHEAYRGCYGMNI